MFILYTWTMKKIFCLLVSCFALISLVLPIYSVNAWSFYDNPVWLVDDIKSEANKKQSEQVQNTDLDVVTSKLSECDWIAPDSRFTLTRTFCSIKKNIKDYLQYVMYFWTILLIINWFKIVTSKDRENAINSFKDNLRHIVIWVVLLIWFYYIIDVFVSVVNLIAE